MIYVNTAHLKRKEFTWWLAVPSQAAREAGVMKHTKITKILFHKKLEPMTNQQAIDILTRHNAWRRDNVTEFPELPDSPALIGEAIDVAIKALRDLDEAKDWLKGSTFLIDSEGWKKDIEDFLGKLE